MAAATRSSKGELGRKTGKGLYEWKNDKAVEGSATRRRRLAEMTDRLILPMVDMCVACLREGIVVDEDTVDGAMIFATGFAPFRGGPHALRPHARRRQMSAATLERLAQRHGERFLPDPGWDQLK